MIKQMIQLHINSLFKELEEIATEVAEVELKKQNTSSLKELTAESMSIKTQKRMASITIQLQILSNISGRKEDEKEN